MREYRISLFLVFEVANDSENWTVGKVDFQTFLIDSKKNHVIFSAFFKTTASMILGNKKKMSIKSYWAQILIRYFSFLVDQRVAYRDTI